MNPFSPPEYPFHPAPPPPGVSPPRPSRARKVRCSRPISVAARPIRGPRDTIRDAENPDILNPPPTDQGTAAEPPLLVCRQPHAT